MNKKTIEEFIGFVEGEISAEIFYNNLCNNREYELTLKSDSAPFPFLKNYNNNLFDFFKIDIGFNKKNLSIRDKAALHGEIERFLEKHHYMYKAYNGYGEVFKMLIEIQPDWLDISDERFLMNIINQAPKELTETKKKAWCKNRIKELFKYDSRPPRWVQEPEWPIKKGNPLVFKGQTKEKLDDERVHFYFYDPDTGEEEVVTQMY